MGLAPVVSIFTCTYTLWTQKVADVFCHLLQNACTHAVHDHSRASFLPFFPSLSKHSFNHFIFSAVESVLPDLFSDDS